MIFSPGLKEQPKDLIVRLASPQREWGGLSFHGEFSSPQVSLG